MGLSRKATNSKGGPPNGQQAENYKLYNVHAHPQ